MIENTQFQDSAGRTFKVVRDANGFWQTIIIPTIYAPSNVETIEVLESVSDDVFAPNFGLYNEPSSVYEIWRDNSEPNFFGTQALKLTNQSNIPSAATSMKFTYEVVDNDFPLNGNNQIQTVNHTNPVFFYFMDYTTPTSLTVNMTGSYTTLAWSNTAEKYAPTKTINIVSNIPHSNIYVYPTYHWNPSTTSFDLLSANPLTESPGPCAFDYCHTEIVHLSAAEATGGIPVTHDYNWIVQNTIVPTLPETDQEVATTIGGSGVSEHRIGMQITNEELPYGMPVWRNTDSYFDSGSGEFYKNYNETVGLTAGVSEWMASGDFLREDPNTGVLSISTVPYPQINIPGDYLDIRQVLNIEDETPLELADDGEFGWFIIKDNSIESFTSNFPEDIWLLSANNAPMVYEEIPYFKPTLYYIYAFSSYALQSRDPFVINDFCDTRYSSFAQLLLTAYPVEPIFYTSNKYVVTGQDVVYENLVPDNTMIQNFTWTDRGNTFTPTTNVQYITSYATADTYSIRLDTTYDTERNGTLTEVNEVSGVVNVLNEFNVYDPDIRRIYQAEDLILPLRLDQCEVPANDFITQFNINESLEKLKTNLEFIGNFSQLYDNPPTEYYGWLGSYEDYEVDSLPWHWRVNLPKINHLINEPELANGDVWKDINVRRVTGISDNVHVVTNGTEVQLLSSDFFATQITSLSSKGIGDELNNVVALGTDNNFSTDSRVYILDKGKNQVIVYKYNFDTRTWALLYSWGGLGGPNAKNKFRAPEDLFIDQTNSLWVVDSGNLVVKKYSRSGSWLATFKSDEFTGNTPRSVVVDENGGVHVLCDKNIVRFDSDGTIISTYFNHNGEYTRIRPCTDNGFFYVVSSSKVTKIIENGDSIGEIGDVLNVTYNSAYHDEFRNLYMTTDTGAIVKFVDKLDVLNLRLDTDDLIWPTDAIQIDSEEYIQDWVVNKCLARLYDNIEVYRRSLVGRFENIIEDGVKTPTIRSFKLDEFSVLPYSKDDIYIGINELVTAPVFNRCISKLYECMAVVLELVDD